MKRYIWAPKSNINSPSEKIHCSVLSWLGMIHDTVQIQRRGCTSLHSAPGKHTSAPGTVQAGSILNSVQFDKEEALTSNDVHT